MLMMLMQGDRVMQYRELVYNVACGSDQLLSEEDLFAPIPLSGVGADYHRTCCKH